jgi:hypothetical protein
MKRTPRKLALRGETLRTLANMDLMRVVGGSETLRALTNMDLERVVGVPDTGDKACTSTAIVVSATAACR